MGWMEVVVAMLDDDDPPEGSNLDSIPPHITCHTSLSAEPESVDIVTGTNHNAVDLILLAEQTHTSASLNVLGKYTCEQTLYTATMTNMHYGFQIS